MKKTKHTNKYRITKDSKKEYHAVTVNRKTGEYRVSIRTYYSVADHLAKTYTDDDRVAFPTTARTEKGIIEAIKDKTGIWPTERI